ncbi:MAG TPA: group II intron reverse transcriptase/maturase [Clostridium sp.]|uniref:group II intron reverse transcriptase/maturase n=1 Tax=Clostridium sp. TaxID=1506 RepID=UPI002F92735D
MTISEEPLLKKQKLRNNEYYDSQEIQDILYRKSKENYVFKDLISEIITERNILLAYRNIKNNKGSKTAGVNETTIKYIENYRISEWVEYIQERFKNYVPMSVRRVEIPKPDGGIRPLGIPTIEDRMVQQCIKQILEPIVEAKFYHGSYGFRCDRSAENAIAKVNSLVNINKLHYAVDIDIKGFFDNVNHGKLLKQMWTLGIKDKALISIISKMLKAEIEGIGIPDKGTPQGGILSPILSNIVLNELDWWIDSQWRGVKTKGSTNYCSKIKTLKKSRLKEMYIVRYADDFKILTKDAKSAQRIFIAVSKWLKERLGLDINKEKSKVINLRKNYSNFLGFKIKAVKKRKSYVINSRISDKAKKKITEKYRNQIDKIKNKPKVYNVDKINSMILGWHNYYRIATHVNLDFSEINYLVRKRLFNRTRSIRSDKIYPNKTYERIYGRYNFKSTSICKTTIFPIAGIKFKLASYMKNVASRYTIEGRYYLHKDLEVEYKEAIKFLVNNPVKRDSIEKNDNRISLYVAQKGLCHISKVKLDLNNMVTRNKLPKYKGGTDKYHNLILVNKEMSYIIDEEVIEEITQLKQGIKLDEKAFIKINALRKLVGNLVILNINN